MERFKCRVCFKNFFNGKALGGHMRSHMLNLSSKREFYELSLEDEAREEELPSQLSEYETESNPSSSSDLEVNEDEEAGSSRINLTRRRSKRTRKLGSFEPEHHSSASDTTTEEDLAFCLIMLSRDKWEQTVEEEEEDEVKDYKESKNKGRFKCETCGRVFKSYQALGGHRASHKKNKNSTTTMAKIEYEKRVNEKKIHQCPICFRVFSSGQALGGHKRSHGSNQVVRMEEEEEEEVKERMIDLNLPASTEDDEW